jgi:hypothetical protein
MHPILAGNKSRHFGIAAPQTPPCTFAAYRCIERQTQLQARANLGGMFEFHDIALKRGIRNPKEIQNDRV